MREYGRGMAGSDCGEKEGAEERYRERVLTRWRSVSCGILQIGRHPPATTVWTREVDMPAFLGSSRPVLKQKMSCTDSE